MSSLEQERGDMVLEHRHISRMLETGIVAARLAGQRAMEEINFIKASIKSNKIEMVTETDRRCQQIIVDRIKETYPDHGFIAEEGGKEKIFKQAPRGAEPIWWVIDPLDGSRNFASQIPFFGTSISLFKEKIPIVGVVSYPFQNQLFYATKNNGAYLKDTSETQKKIHIDKKAILENASCSTGTG